MAFKELFGDFVVDGSYQQVPVEKLEGKHVGIYFSAHWCPPCRMFTPELVKVFNSLRESKNWEIVFVSSDRDEGAFKEYFAEMPWYALPYSDRDRKNKLSKKYKVQGIPTLVILKPDGSVATTNGREGASEDPKGARFPWAPRPLWDIVPATLQTKAGATVNSSTLRDLDAIGFYFSAHWCGPCRKFTPSLVKSYEAMKAAGKKFEIVFVSSDQDANAFKKYYAEMPWLAVDFEEDEARQELNRHFEVEGIPKLAIVDAKSGELITADGRLMVDSDPEGADFPWRPQPHMSVTRGAELLNESPCLIALLDKLDNAGVKAAKAALTAVAERCVGRKTAGDDGVYFLSGTAGEMITERIRAFTNVEKSNVLLLDVPNQRKAVSHVESFTEESIQSIADKYFAGTLSWLGARDPESSNL